MKKVRCRLIQNSHHYDVSVELFFYCGNSGGRIRTNIYIIFIIGGHKCEVRSILTALLLYIVSYTYCTHLDQTDGWGVNLYWVKKEAAPAICDMSRCWLHIMIAQVWPCVVTINATYKSLFIRSWAVWQMYVVFREGYGSEFMSVPGAQSQQDYSNRCDGLWTAVWVHCATDFS